MKASYKRDFHHSYLILQDPEAPACESYTVRMMINSTIPGLLPCEIHKINNQTLFYYDVTSKQTLASIYERKKLNHEDLVLLIEALLRTIEEMERYLLSPACLVLDPEYIYVNPVDRKVNFCYWPHELEGDPHFLKFTEYLLPRIDHQDQDAVVLGYHMYRRAMEGQFCPEEIRQELYRETNRENITPDERGEQEVTKTEPGIDVEKMEQEHRRRQDVLNTLLQEVCEEEEAPRSSKIGVCGAGVCLLIMISVYLVRNQFFSWEVLIGLIGGLALILGAVYLILILVRRKKEEKKDAQPGKDFQNSLSEMTGNHDDILPDITEEAETSLLYTGAERRYGVLKAVYPADLADIRLNQEITVFGKISEVVDVVLPSPAVSRVHAKICWDGKCTVFDLNSRNGTYVNQSDVVGNEGKMIKEGDTIAFADLIYRYTTEESDVYGAP